MAQDLGAILSAAYPQVVATLIRVLGDIDQATDAAQDALVKALQVWGADGVPHNPVAWLVTTGRNRAIDQLRREQRIVSLDSNVVPLHGEPGMDDAAVEDEDVGDVDDDLLRLLFTCCHPALNQSAQMVLMLKVVLGFSNEEIARALLASPASIEKRLTRAKARLREADVPYEVPQAKDIPARLEVVLQAIYVLFNEGYSRVQDSALHRGSLIDVALRLGRMTSRLFRFDPRPRSLLALMLLSAARLPARLSADGAWIPLDAQDRNLWDQGMISEGLAIIDAVYAARHLPGGYQIQAAISAIHAKAGSAAQTDWPQIAALYGKLAEYDPSPVVQVNHAVALIYSERCAEARVLLSAQQVKKLSGYQPYFAALALLEEQEGDTDAACAALERAIELAESSAQRNFLKSWLERLR